MRQVYHPNLALLTDLIIKMLEITLMELTVTETVLEKFDYTIFSNNVTLSYIISLQGLEGFMINFSTMKRKLGLDLGHITIALKEKIEGET